MWIELVQAAVTIGALIWAGYLWTRLRRQKRQSYSTLALEMELATDHDDITRTKILDWARRVRELQTVLKAWALTRRRIYQMREQYHDPHALTALQELVNLIEGVEHGNEPTPLD